MTHSSKTHQPSTVSPAIITPKMMLVPANKFSFAQLTDAYNRTRVDYIVPMPMNERKMRDYVHNYDIDLSQSVVAIEGNEILGLAMLGVRKHATWVTRLGVLPNGRKRGLGWKMMQVLIENSRALGVPEMQLDVIKNNTPAEQLFLKCGFRHKGEVLVVRRPPKPVNIVTTGAYIEAVSYRDSLALLKRRTDHVSWLTDARSMENAGNIAGLVADLPRGIGKGWLVYQNTVFQLGRLVFTIESGDPVAVATALLENLHWRHPAQDTVVENVHPAAAHWQAMQSMGYILSFERLEMVKPMG